MVVETTDGKAALVIDVELRLAIDADPETDEVGRPLMPFWPPNGSTGGARTGL